LANPRGLPRGAEIVENRSMSTPSTESFPVHSPPVEERHIRHVPGYDDDFFVWTQETARAILEGRFDEIDKTALADEVESLGKRDRREVGSRLEVIIMHLLKLKYQPERETQSWHRSIRAQRNKLRLVLRDSPSLRAQSPELLAQIYDSARRTAADQTHLPLSAFPETCPWTLAETLGE
jgi:hypothetical protein